MDPTTRTCEYCDGSEEGRYPRTATGDATLDFDSGNSYEMPLLILHYIADHGYQPPTNLIGDVMNSRPVAVQMRRTTRVGFFAGDQFPIGSSPPSFLLRLASLLGPFRSGTLRQGPAGSGTIEGGAQR